MLLRSQEQSYEKGPAVTPDGLGGWIGLPSPPQSGSGQLQAELADWPVGGLQACSHTVSACAPSTAPSPVRLRTLMGNVDLG